MAIEEGSAAEQMLRQIERAVGSRVTCAETRETCLQLLHETEKRVLRLMLTDAYAARASLEIKRIQRTAK